MIRLNLEHLLNGRGRSYYWLAKNARINPSVMTRMKHHRIKAITLDVLDRICTVLECEPGDVLTRIADEPKRVNKKSSNKQKRGK